MSTIIGVDIGGTFTDLVYFTGDGIRIHKLLSTKTDPSEAFLDGLDALHVAADAVVAHGSTVATNAVLEHSGARIALITNDGFGDVLAIGRQTRPQLYRLSFPPRWMPVADEDVFEVQGRMNSDGGVLAPISREEIDQVLDEITGRGIEAVAVSLLFSFANAIHEQIIGEAAAERGLFTSLSSRILPEYREFERTSTTALNAYVSPIMARYLTRLEQGLTRRGNKTLWVMQSSGGIISAATAQEEAVRTMLSGPAAGVTGAFHVAKLAGYDHIITFDMGGTSTDVSLADGDIRRTSEGSIEGWPVRVPMIDIHTVGAGGGSIAWVDAGEALRVGPQSAGSEPGPVCYGRGGNQFTVTDANLLLGRVSANHFLDGRMALDQAATETAANHLAQTVGLSPIDLAEGVVRVANARIEQAIRVISIEKGFDPRNFTLVPFGGAGPMHALELAESLHIGRVLIPRYPGVLSALGLTLADFVKDYSRTVMWALDDISADDLAWAFQPLLEQGQADIRAEGFASDQIVLTPALDLRYRGQSFELTVIIDDFEPQEAVQRFYAAHQRRYGYAREQEPVELVNIRVTARGIRPQPDAPALPSAPSPDPAPALVGETRLRFSGVEHAAPIYQRSSLLPEHQISGPALIVQEDATTVVPPTWSGEVDGWGNLIFQSTNQRSKIDD